MLTFTKRKDRIPNPISIEKMLNIFDSYKFLLKLFFLLSDKLAAYNVFQMVLKHYFTLFYEIDAFAIKVLCVKKEKSTYINTF